PGLGHQRRGRARTSCHQLNCSALPGENICAMTKIWVTRPGDEPNLPGVEAEAARLQAEIGAIEALGNPSACCICGRQAALTVEHAPSKKAGNVGPMIRGMIDDVASSTVGAVRWQTERTYGATDG